MTLGAFIGIIARDQMTANMYQFPITLIFTLPYYGIFSEPINKLGGFTPCISTMEIVKNYINGSFLNIDTLYSCIVVVFWIVISFILLSYASKKCSL